ncbi:MAG: Smr/MutS family protein [Armatimonadetes bacterium]|nr:Smr/MutS family protein [Armatimonadota bacterium]
METVSPKTLQDEHSLRVLEYGQVLEIMARHTHWKPGRDYLMALRPLASRERLLARQQEVSEALRLLEEGSSFPLGGLQDVREAVGAAGRGAVLPPEILLGVRELVLVSRKIGRVLAAKVESAPRLSQLGEVLIPFPRIEQEVGRSVSLEGRILDAASPRLRALRQDLRVAQARVQRALQNILRSPEVTRMLQEPLITQRQGRAVVPVKAEYRGKFPGLVIDQSSSGATVFMEPFSIVDLGNQVRTLETAEEKEIEAILARLSGLVGHDSAELLAACEVLGFLDCILAQARWSLEASAIMPEINQQRRLRLVQARHPLLRGDPVPITVELGGSFSTLVITGPNTGGKTVCLKTLGLLSLLALSGVPIPAGPGSTVPFLTSVWADIGDEQSIAQSLSTFSSHLTQILRFLPESGPESLILLDELGAGTDPTEGGALGIALLDELTARGAMTAVTTHLSQLKVYASKTEGFENAAVEFDAGSLRPTYRVIMGIPGRSNALQIADRLGLPRPVLRRAREFLGTGHVGVEDLLDDLEQEREAVRHLESRMTVENTELERLRRDYQQKLDGFETEREQMFDRAAHETEEMVTSARTEVHSLLKHFRKRMAAMDRARREALEQARKPQVEPPPAPVDPPASFEEEDLEAREAELGLTHQELETLPRVSETEEKPESGEDEYDAAARVEARTVEAGLGRVAEEVQPHRVAVRRREPSAVLAPGASVYSRSLGQEGIVESHRGGRVVVRIGVVRITLDRSDLEEIEPRPASSDVRLPESGRDTFTASLDLRGLTVDEALFELDRKLDAAAMARAEKVEVIHGKGTGALQRGVHQHLKRHPQVADYRFGEIYEGGTGVTVVSLKR